MFWSGQPALCLKCHFICSNETWSMKPHKNLMFLYLKTSVHQRLCQDNIEIQRRLGCMTNKRIFRIMSFYNTLTKKTLPWSLQTGWNTYHVIIFSSPNNPYTKELIEINKYIKKIDCMLLMFSGIVVSSAFQCPSSRESWTFPHPFLAEIIHQYFSSVLLAQIDWEDSLLFRNFSSTVVL